MEVERNFGMSSWSEHRFARNVTGFLLGFGYHQDALRLGEICKDHRRQTYSFTKLSIAQQS